MENFTNELIIAGVGIAGTLLGTILGWVLSVLTRFRRIKVFINNIDETFRRSDNIGSTEPSPSMEETEYYTCKVKFEVYNRSDNPKIMRDFKLRYKSSEKIIYDLVPNDCSTRRSNGAFYMYDELGSATIPGKTIQAFEITVALSEKSLSPLWSTKTIELLYRNSANNLCKKRLKNVDYPSLFQLEAENTVNDELEGPR